MPILEIDGIGKVEVGNDFLSMTPEQQGLAVEEMAATVRGGTQPAPAHPPQAQASAAPKPGTFGNVLRGVTSSLFGNDPSQGTQVGPLVRNDQGDFVQLPSGELQPIQTNQFLVQTGEGPMDFMVFQRGETEGALDAARKVSSAVATGLVAGAPTRIPSAAATAAPRAPIAAAAERQGIGLTAPTASDSRVVQGLSATAREIPGASNIIQRGIQREVGEVAQAAERTAAQAGTAAGRSQAGRAVRGGLTKFEASAGKEFDLRAVEDAQLTDFITRPSRESSFSKKAAALYEQVRRGLGSGIGRMEPNNTIAALDKIEARFNNPKLREQFGNSFFGTLRKSIDGPQTWSDLRQARTEIRQLKADKLTDAERTVSNAQVKQIESALTQDIYTLTQQMGGKAALARLQRADKFYSAGIKRLDTVKSLLKVKSDEQLYDRILRLASDKGGASIKQLNQVSRSLGNEQWGDVAAVAIRRMGRPTAGAAAEAVDTSVGAFSPSTFATNYAALSDRGKTVLFSRAGMHDLRKAMDDLVTIAEAQKRSAKFSVPTGGGTGIGRQATTGIIGLALTGFFDAWATALTAITTSAIAAKVMTSPKIVRALGRIMRAEKGPEATARVPPEIARLRELLLANEEFAPFADDLISQAQEEGPVSAEPQPDQNQ